MPLQMQRAFNSKMLYKITRHVLSGGGYDENNHWVEGTYTPTKVFGVFKTGNQFSQFDEGEALHSEDGGVRYSNFKTLYVTDKFLILKTDKFEYKGKYFNVLQRSDESIHGFYSALVEESEIWKP